MLPIILLNVVGKIVDGLITNPTIPVTPADANAVTKQVVKELVPIVEHLTNNEPWYASRVTWGAIATILSGVSALIMSAANGETSMDVYAAAVTGIAGGAYTLYGRWAARKPLGAK